MAGTPSCSRGTRLYALMGTVPPCKMGEGFLLGSGDKDVFPNGDALAFANATGAPDDALRADLESYVHGRPPSVPSSAWVLILTQPLASCSYEPVSASVSPAIKGRQSQHLPQGEVVGINKSIYMKHLKQLSTWWGSVGHRKQILVPACTSSRDKAKEGSRSPWESGESHDRGFASGLGLLRGLRGGFGPS